MKKILLLIVVSLLGCSGCAALRQSKEWESFNVAGPAIADREAIRVAVGKDGSIWVARLKGLLTVIKGKDRKIYSVRDFEGYCEDYRRRPRIYLLEVDPTGRVWVATGEGLYTLMKDGKWHKCRIVESEEPLWRQVCRVEFLTTGPDGTVWVSTGSLRKVIVSDNDVRFSPPYLYVHIGSIAVAADGKVWMCMPGEGIGVFDGKRLEKIYGLREGLRTKYIRKVFIDSEGNVWALDGGISLLRGGLWITVLDPGVLGTSKISSFIVSLDGKLWIGTSKHGVFVYDRNGTCLAHYTFESGLPGDSIKDIKVSADGNIWVATEGGVAVHMEISDESK